MSKTTKISLSKLDGGRLSISRNTGYAVYFDGKVVAAHLHAEETVFSPVGTPGVAANPVSLLAFFVKAVANNRDLVVNHGEEHVLAVDASEIVLLEVLGCVYTAGDGAMGIKLSLHLVSTTEVVVVTDVVLGVSNSETTTHAVVTDSGWGPGAFTASVNVCAHTSLEVVGSILLAGFVLKSDVMGELVNLGGAATVARASGLAIDNMLG